MAEWLENEYGILTVVEPEVAKELPKLKSINISELGNVSLQNIDFCIVIGGDGTLLHLNSLFQELVSVPPVLPLAKGSLGFLMPYTAKDYKIHLKSVLEKGSQPQNVTNRTRLMCQQFKSGEEKPNFSYQVMNELLVYRGISPYLTILEFYVDEQLATHIQADGVIISSPTGSTAYSLSAGGAMMPSDVPAILVTPICPHSLSFRPIVLPDCCMLKIRVPEDSRSSVIASFDGRSPLSLEKGDYITIRTSSWPMPTFSMLPSMVEWFRSIKERLNWNVRELQKPLPDEPPSEIISSSNFNEKKH